MSWRTVVISKSQQIKLKNNNFCVINEDKQEILFPFTQLNSIILENNYCLTSSQVLSKLVENDVYVIVCNERHEPTGILLSLSSHFQPLAVFERQINMNDNFKDVLWTKIIIRKIENSISILRNYSDDQSAIEMLDKFANSVITGDKTNREGLAAKVFFRSLYGSSFLRFSDDDINKALNYGYKMLVSCISRTLVKYGLNLYIGIHHIGKTNPFNLSYDFIEPFRPLIDEWVITNLNLLNNGLTYNQRIELLNILNKKIIIDEKIMTIISAIEVMIKSFISCLINQTTDKLKLPELFYNNINDVQYEKDDEGY